MTRPTRYLLRFLILALAPALGAAQSDQRGALPADVDPESLSRLPVLERSELDAEGRRVYDMIIGDRPHPRTGPLAVSIYSPTVAEAFALLNDYLRSEDAVLDPRYYEVAIMVAAWEFEQAYEWAAHEAAARNYGVPEAVIDTIKYDREVRDLSSRDSLIIRFGRALLRDHSLDSATYAEAVDLFGKQGMVELATTIGDYVMVGLVLTAADQHVPPDRADTLPRR